MIKAFILASFRHYRKRKAYTLLNLFSLSAGLTSLLAVILYVNHELSFDDFHHDSENVYRVVGRSASGWLPALGRPYSEAVMERPSSQIKLAARIRRVKTGFVKLDDKKFIEDHILATDPASDFFKIFDFPFVAGEAKSALALPNSVIMSSTAAHKYFGEKNPVGATISYDTLQLTVTGVFKDLPSNTHLVFDFLMTDSRMMQRSSGAFTYCVLVSGANTQAIAAQILNLVEAPDPHYKIEEVKLQPLQSLHYDSSMIYEMKPAGSYNYLFLFPGIGVLILIISATNYISLSVALYAERAKEIAIRKVNGAQNKSLSLQFLSESILFAVLCVPLSLTLLQILLPWFNTFMDLRLENDFVFSAKHLVGLILIVSVIGIVCGLYPAIALPRLKTVSLFKKSMPSEYRGLSIRKVLVCFQFAVLVLLICSSWMIKNQITFIQQKDLGFVKEGVVKISNTWNVDSAQYQQVKVELMHNPQIISVSEGTAPGDEDFPYEYRTEGSDEINNDLIYTVSDYDYLKTLEIDVLQCELELNPGKRPGSAVLINETLARKMDFENPVGKTVTLFPNTPLEQVKTINGVIRDYHFFSLHEAINPQLILMREFSPAPGRENILVKIAMDEPAQTLKFIESKMQSIVPDEALAFRFMDDDLNDYYEQEQKLSELSNGLLSISVFLAFSGLVGLVSYITGLKVKEIGVRKILGASSFSIQQLLAGNFVLSFIVSAAVGAAGSYFIIQFWLKNFAFQTTLEWTVFILSGVAAVAVALGTIMLQALRVSRTNPAEALKHE